MKDCMHMTSPRSRVHFISNGEQNIKFKTVGTHSGEDRPTRFRPQFLFGCNDDSNTIMFAPLNRKAEQMVAIPY